MNINFTKEHLDRLKEMSSSALFSKWSVKAPAPIKAEYTIYDILHVVGLDALKNILKTTRAQIESAESEDEWISTPKDQNRLNSLKFTRELVNLTIGYRRLKIALQDEAAEKARLEKELAALKEANKTPEEKIKECEEKLAKFNAIPSFAEDL